MQRFANRVAIVTGGASGIGLATATLLAQEGACVVIFDRDAAKGAGAVRAIAAAGGQARAVQGDVTVAADAQQAVQEALTAFGRLDVLVNNAAIGGPDDVLSTDEPAWDETVDIVLKGPFLFTQAALPAMVQRRSGSIVNVASVNGLLALGNDAYSAAKAGVINLTKSVATRYGVHGIRANAVCPGTVRTPIWQAIQEKTPDIFEQLARWYPLGRVGEPEDIARAVLFLASEDAAWITGAVLAVDGGLTSGIHRMAVELQGEE